MLGRAALAVGGVVLIGVGLLVAFDWEWGAKADATVMRTVDARVGTVTVDNGSGEVSVRAADVERTTVRQHFRYDEMRPDDTFEVDGDVLTLRECDGDCSVDYEVLVPRGVLVDGETGSGEVELTDIGSVDVESGSGDVRVTTSEPADVRVSTGSGSVDVTVPDDGYRIAGETDSGEREIGVSADDGADHTLDLSSDSGDVVVHAG